MAGRYAHVKVALAVFLAPHGLILDFDGGGQDGVSFPAVDMQGDIFGGVEVEPQLADAQDPLELVRLTGEEH